MRTIATADNRGVLLFVLAASLVTGAEVNGIVRVVPPNTRYSDPMKLPTPMPAWATLCSRDRVYRVESDREGKFVFQNIKSGEYDLVVATRYYDPELVTRLKLGDKRLADPIVALVHWGERKNSCYVSTEGHNLVKDFDIEYDEPKDGVDSLVI